MTDWTYSHTQLSTYAACKRLYHDRYVLGIKEPTTAPMAYGTHMLHGPIETYLRSGSVLDHDWELAWANFLAAIGQDETYDDPIYTLKTGKRCLSLYKASPIEGDVQCVEDKFYYTFPDGHRYVSIPDFVVGRETARFTVDLKFTTKWKLDPLLPYDDQCLGQAICAGADGFIRMTFKADKKSGKVEGPYIEEHLVDPVLRDQWIGETWNTCREIESWRKLTGARWPKNDQHCYKYGGGKPCYRLGDCKAGA